MPKRQRARKRQDARPYFTAYRSRPARCTAGWKLPCRPPGCAAVRSGRRATLLVDDTLMADTLPLPGQWLWLTLSLPHSRKRDWEYMTAKSFQFTFQVQLKFTNFHVLTMINFHLISTHVITQDITWSGHPLSQLRSVKPRRSRLLIAACILSALGLLFSARSLHIMDLGFQPVVTFP